VQLAGAVRRSRDLQRLVLAVYGIALVAAVVGDLALTLPGRNFISSRHAGVTASIDAMAKGAPPLTGYVPAIAADGQPAAYPIGVGDDEGIYLLLPWLARATGVQDATVALFIFTAALMGSVILLYPVLLLELFDSFLVGVLAPLALMTQFRSFLSSDIYWIPAWTVLALLPFVLIAYRHWSRSAVLTLGLALALASFASSMRGHSGLPILLAAVVVVLFRERKLLPAVLFVLSFVAIYFSVGPGILGVARSQRDAQLGTDWGRSTLGAHPFWHPVYLGLGYLPNPYGIQWNDTVAFEAVQREDPTAGYVTREYEASLRRQFFAILQRDPGFVLATYAVKSRQLVQDLMTQYLPLILFVPIAVVSGVLRYRMRMLVVLATPALVINAMPPLLGIPNVAFEHGWLASGALLWLLGIGWAIVAAPGAAISFRQGVLGAFRVSRNPANVAHWLSRNVRLLLVLATVAIATIYGTRLLNEELSRLETSKIYLENSARLGPAQTVGQPVVLWSLKELPPSWWANPGATGTTASDGLAIATTAEKFTYQLTSPIVTLGPGAYQLSVKARPNTGGMTIGVLDADRDSWVVTQNYSAVQGGFDEGTMIATFKNTDARNVQIVLANWSPNGHRSTWLLQEVGLYSVSD
jgi:hypothetical protein